MKKLATVVAGLAAIVLVCGCGTQEPGSGPPPNPPLLSINGNWQFSATSSVLGGPPSAKLAGGITQTVSSLVGAVHVDGWSCFDQRTTIGLSGTITGSDISLTSASVNGQVLTLSGSIDPKTHTFTGTYSITGGCASGDQGTATGSQVVSITGDWSGALTSDGGERIQWDAKMTQARVSSEGRFGLSGTVNFDSCFTTGTITPGALPESSFIMGTTVDLKIKTDATTLTFLGTKDPDGLIRGKYSVSGGPCDLTGTGSLSPPPWDY